MGGERWIREGKQELFGEVGEVPVIEGAVEEERGSVPVDHEIDHGHVGLGGDEGELEEYGEAKGPKARSRASTARTCTVPLFPCLQHAQHRVGNAHPSRRIDTRKTRSPASVQTQRSPKLAGHHPTGYRHL